MFSPKYWRSKLACHAPLLFFNLQEKALLLIYYNSYAPKPTVFDFQQKQAGAKIPTKNKTTKTCCSSYFYDFLAAALSGKITRSPRIK